MPDRVKATLRGHIPDDSMVLYKNGNPVLGPKDWPTKDRKLDDYVAKKLTDPRNSIPTSEHIIFDFTPISDQGSAGTCVANALMDSLEILVGLEKGPSEVEQMSRRFCYFLARVTHKATDVDLGTHIRAGCYQMNKIGVLPESWYPYSDKNHMLCSKEQAPRTSHYSKASDLRILGYYRITETGLALPERWNQVIRANHPIPFALPVNQEFQAYRGGGEAWSDMPKSKGNHAMLAIGVRRKNNKLEFKIRNSWSRYWGEAGYVWISQDLIASKAFDCWVATRKNI